MILKLCFVFALFATVTIATAEETVRFSIETVWQSSKRDGAIRPAYVDGIQKYYDEILESFRKFPAGPLLDGGETLITTFQNYLSKLVVFSSSNSTVLSASSTAILETLSTVNVSVTEPLAVIEEFYRILPNLMLSYRSVVSNLSTTIGGLSDYVNNALTDLESAFRNHMSAFLQSDEHGRRKIGDFKPIARNAQRLSSTISLIATTTQNTCELRTSDVHGSLIALTLVLDHLMICFHGLSGCSQAVVIEQKSDEPFEYLGFYSTLGVYISGITKSLVAIDSPNENGIAELSRGLTSSNDLLNSKLNDLFGAFDGVAVAGTEIAKTISKNVSGAICGVTNRISNTLGGLGRPKIGGNIF